MSRVLWTGLPASPLATTAESESLVRSSAAASRLLFPSHSTPFVPTPSSAVRQRLGAWRKLVAYTRATHGGRAVQPGEAASAQCGPRRRSGSSTCRFTGRAHFWTTHIDTEASCSCVLVDTAVIASTSNWASHRAAATYMFEANTPKRLCTRAAGYPAGAFHAWAT